MIADDECGPSGWPEATPEQRQHAVRMLKQTISARRRALVSRKRADIAARPSLRTSIEEIQAHVARLMKD